MYLVVNLVYKLITYVNHYISIALNRQSDDWDTMPLKPLPKWLFIRYSKLWRKNKSQEFDFSEARSLLNEKDDRTLSVILSDLRKNGWLEAYLGSEDARKRKYRLIPPQDAVEKIAEINSK